MLGQTVIVPPPRLAITRWLTAATEPLCDAAAAELRGAMVRRLAPVLVSAGYSIAIAAIALIYHPTPAFRLWLLLDAVVFAVRVPLVIAIILTARRGAGTGRLNPWVIDRFVGAGTAWSAVLGFGSLISLRSNDPGLSVLIALLAIGTSGAQCARNPGTPRLNMLQIGLITVPMTAGACLSAIPLISLVLLLAPLFVSGMMVITFQLHRDYVELIVERLESRRRALHCALTRLPNRVSFDDSLGAAVDAASGSVAVLCLDLDGFKAVNDTFGHPIGDVVLQQVAGRLAAMVPPPDVVARLGGDEFAILLHESATFPVEALAERVITELGRPYDLGRVGTANIGVSVGIAVANADTDKLQGARLLENADAALYEAKRAGRGVFRFYGPPVERAMGYVPIGPPVVTPRRFPKRAGSRG